MTIDGAGELTALGYMHGPILTALVIGVGITALRIGSYCRNRFYHSILFFLHPYLRLCLALDLYFILSWRARKDLPKTLRRLLDKLAYVFFG